MGIARDADNTIYVAGGGSNNIVKFDTGGGLLGEITHPDLTGPQGVAFDDRGHLFSSSFYQHQVVEFDGDGNYVQTITDGDLSIPRSVTFVRMAVGDVDDDGTVGVTDLLALLGAWGPCPDPPQACPADGDGDGNVGVTDLLTLLANWS